MTKELLRNIIGENIRTERMARNISIDELAEMLELTSGFVGLIERGQRGTTPNTLFKLSEVFGMTIDSFFYKNKNDSSALSFGEEYIDNKQAKRKKIESLIRSLSEKELEFVIATLKNLRAMRPIDEGDDSEAGAGSDEGDGSESDLEYEDY